MLLKLRGTNAGGMESKSLHPHPFLKTFSSFIHSNKSRFTVDMPRHLGLTHILKASGTAHTQEKSLKCTMGKKTPLLYQPLRMSFSLASIRLPMGKESHLIEHCLNLAKQALNVAQSSQCWHGLSLCLLCTARSNHFLLRQYVGWHPYGKLTPYKSTLLKLSQKAKTKDKKIKDSL